MSSRTVGEGTGSRFQWNSQKAPGVLGRVTFGNLRNLADLYGLSFPNKAKTCVAKWPEDKWDKQATKIPERMERIAKLPLFGNGDVSMVKRIPYEKLQEALKLIFDEELTGTENRSDLEKKMQRCNQESETARLQYRRQLVDSQVLQTMNSVEVEPPAARAVSEQPCPIIS